MILINIFGLQKDIFTAQKIMKSLLENFTFCAVFAVFKRLNLEKICCYYSNHNSVCNLKLKSNRVAFKHAQRVYIAEE